MTERPLPAQTAVLARRFWAKTAIQTNGCVLWTGARQTKGYGSFGFGPRGACVTFLAHRVAYAWLVGPIPDGMTIDHLCRRKACVNVAHMEVVTRRINSQRGSVANTWWHRQAERVAS